MVRTLASDELSTSVTWPSVSRSSSSMSLSPPCHSGAVRTSSTTSHTCSIGASISAVDEPLIVPMLSPLSSFERGAYKGEWLLYYGQGDAGVGVLHGKSRTGC